METESARPWHDKIKAYDKRMDKWTAKSKKIVERYRDESKKADETGVNILWANNEIIKSALLPKLPRPDVRRRHADARSKTPVARVAATVLERALSTVSDNEDLFEELDAGSDDFLLTGRCVMWLEYVPVVEGEEVTQQDCRWRHVYWQDFAHGEARKFRDLPWAARRIPMTRKNAEKAFPQYKDKLTADYKFDTETKAGENEATHDPKVEIWEIWDKATRRRLYITPTCDEVLKVTPDPYHLKGFFPCRVIYDVKTTDSLIPVPSFVLWQDLANELDRVTGRIAALTERLKYVGFYRAAEDEDQLAQVFKAGDGTFVPYKGWTGDLSGSTLWDQVVAVMPIDRIAQVLEWLFQQRNQLLDAIYQVTGISDIVRGSTDPRETKGAQQIKSQYAGLRFERRRTRFNNFIRDLYRDMGELIAEHYTAPSLMALAGEDAGEMGQPQNWDEVVDLLRNDRLRGYRLDVETDQTSLIETEADKKAHLEGLQILREMVSDAYAAAAVSPKAAMLAKEMVLLGMRVLKPTRGLEQNVEDLFDEVIEKPPAPKPSKEEMDAQVKQAEVQRKAQKDQMDFAAKQQDTKIKEAGTKIEGFKAMVDMQDKRQDNEREDRRLEHEMRQPEKAES